LDFGGGHFFVKLVIVMFETRLRSILYGTGLLLVGFFMFSIAVNPGWEVPVAIGSVSLFLSIVAFCYAIFGKWP
jgi:hypothetical protein